MTDVQAPDCIFCGGKTRINPHFHAMRDFVECESCVIRGPTRPTPAEAVAAFLKPVADARREALDDVVEVANAERAFHMKEAEEWREVYSGIEAQVSDGRAGVLYQFAAKIHALMTAPSDAPEDAA